MEGFSGLEEVKEPAPSVLYLSITPPTPKLIPQSDEKFMLDMIDD